MHPQDSTLRALQAIYCTVVVVDLVGYSTVARVLEENTSAAAVFELNRRIQEFVKEALLSIPTTAYSLLSETGDGAILLFDDAEQAHAFAERLHQNSERHNTTRTESSAHRLFRVGIATGEIVLDGDEVKSGYAGITIANAARLESAAKPGEIVIDSTTFQALSILARGRYSNETAVRGKREEVFQVRKYMALELPAPALEAPLISKGRASRIPPRFKIISVLGVAAVVLSCVSWAAWRFYPRIQPFSSISTEQLTDSGDITNIAISPDGKTLAEVRFAAGRNSIWARNISTGKEFQILAPIRLAYASLVFSKDGNELYFVREDADQSGSHVLYSVPVFGGEPRLLVRNLGYTISLSPDDQRIAFITALADTNEVHIVDIASSEDKIIAKAKGHDLSEIAWSPGGRSLAWANQVNAIETMGKISPTITLLDLNSKQQRDISLPHGTSVSQLSWLPTGKQIMLMFTKPYTGVRAPGGQIGLVSIDSGDFRQLSDDMIAHSGLALSADGMSVATLLQQSISEVVVYDASGVRLDSTARLPRLATGFIWLSEEKLFVDEFNAFQILGRNNGQLTDFELMYPRGSYPHGFWTSDTSNTTPAACPDGHFVFTGTLNGVDQLYLVDAHGQFVRSLVQVRGANIFCGSDSTFAYYSVPDVENSSIWKMPLSAGSPSKVISVPGSSPIFYSNDGKFAAYRTDDANHSTATIINLDQRSVVRELPLTKHAPGTPVKFTTDRAALTFVEQEDQGFALASQPLDGSTSRVMTAWVRDPISDFEWSPSGKLLAMLSSRSSSDIALIRDRADKARD